jgi:hypothetical protein
VRLRREHDAADPRCSPIRLCAVNDAKIAMLDALAAAYMALCQQYVTLFCAGAEPNDYADPSFPSPLSQRWQRVAIQPAAGSVRSWRTNHERAQEDCADTLAAWLVEERQPGAAPPEWRPWQILTLRKTLIQANAKVALLQSGQPIFLPVTLSAYHERCLADKQVDSNVTLLRKPDGWWLTLSYEEEVSLLTRPDAPLVGGDAGITHFLTTSTGKRYGAFQGKLAQRRQRDREMRRRNAKLARAVRQEINRAVNELYRDHAGCQIAGERLNVATMRYTARRMNAYLYASNEFV